MYITRNSTLAANKILDEIKNIDGKITFPIDPFRLLKVKNTVITFSNFDKLEGLLLFDHEKESVVSININRPITRQRFTAAHELGHIMLHTKMNDENFWCPIYGIKSDIEKEADEFASNLLMPSYELIKQINKYQDENGKVNLDDCLLISEYFGVSFESCVKTICFRLKRFVQVVTNEELTKIIKKYGPVNKRKELFKETNDLQLLLNSINYSYFSLINVSNIIGIKFIQRLVYHDNRLENIDLTDEETIEIFADFRVNGGNSKYCISDNQNIIEALGNIEMNTYCLSTDDKIDLFKIKDLNKLLYKYAPYPEFTGEYRKDDNIILGGNIQPVSVLKLFNEISELNTLVEDVISNIDKYSISEYINIVANIHYKLTILHPFADGNGRISRAFLNWLLRAKGLCPIFIDFSNRKAYLNALNNIDKGNSNTELQIIIIKAIISTMAELHESWN